MENSHDVDHIEPFYEHVPQGLPTFLEFSNKMDIHGYYFIGKERGLRKFLWCILFISAIVFSVIMARRCVREFLTYTVYQEIKDFPYLERNLPLPTVTICNQVSLSEQSYLRLKQIVNVTEREYEEFHTRYLTKYASQIEPNRQIEKRILDALQMHNITSMEDIYNFFEINYTEMFGDPIANVLLQPKHPTLPDMSQSKHPTCRYRNNRHCSVTSLWCDVIVV